MAQLAIFIIKKFRRRFFILSGIAFILIISDSPITAFLGYEAIIESPFFRSFHAISMLILLFLGAYILVFPLIRKASEQVAVLEESEEKLKNIVEHSTNVFYSHTPDHILTYLSPQIKNLLGYEPEEALRKWTELATDNPVNQKALELTERAFKTGKRQPPYEIELRHKDGRIVWGEIYESPVVKNGVVTGIVGALADITEEKKDEIRIKELNELRKEFIRIVSHQLRTPVTAMRFNLEQMLEDAFGKIPEAQKDILQIIYKANLGIIARIGDMIKAIDIEEGRELVRKESFAFDALFNASLVNLKREFPNRKVKVIDNGASGIGTIICDQEKMLFIFEKIFNNAILYSPEDSEIEVKIEKRNDSVYFEVSDKGIGIPPAEQKRVFERFFRGSNAVLMNPNGSGIALFIAKYFVEQHGGKIGFRSEEGMGSAFWFGIPI